MNLLHSFSQGNFVLIAVFLLLVGMSCVSWYVIFRKVLVLKFERKAIAQFRLEYLNSPQILSSLNTEHKGLIGEIVLEMKNLQPLLSTIEGREKKETLAVHLAQKLDIIKIHLDSGLTLLASVSSSSPFIGLFGTVWGIYGALIEISTKGSAGLSVVAAPMGEALTATAVGLFAAIPAAIAYNIFLRYNRLIIQDLRHICEQFTIYSEK